MFRLHHVDVFQSCWHRSQISIIFVIDVIFIIIIVFITCFFIYFSFTFIKFLFFFPPIVAHIFFFKRWFFYCMFGITKGPASTSASRPYSNLTSLYNYKYILLNAPFLCCSSWLLAFLPSESEKSVVFCMMLSFSTLTSSCNSPQTSLSLNSKRCLASLRIENDSLDSTLILGDEPSKEFPTNSSEVFWVRVAIGNQADACHIVVLI